MVFSSVTFLFLFLPVVLVLYHSISLLPRILGSRRKIWWTLSNLCLLACSLVFYYWGEQSLVWLFVGTTLVDYLSALLIAGALFEPARQLKAGATRSLWQKTVLTASICCNLSILIYFKYFHFIGLDSLAWNAVPHVALPLGISFFTFHSMSYTIDVYRGHVRATRNFINYACYVLMFPQLVAGPIVRYSYVARALVERVVTARQFADGVSLFALGLGKKVLIANTVSVAGDRIFALPGNLLTTPLAWIGIVAYTIQIYFDFSGYSDMAIGLGRMFGFELPVNFNYPYISSSMREFWLRWHITMSSWFRDYVYIPLGGNRHKPWRTYANLTAVFFLCGLWHGASWTFVAWGLYHGLFLVAERLVGRSAFPRILRPIGHLYTILAIMIGWVLFRVESFPRAMEFYKAMAGYGSATSPYSPEWFLTTEVTLAMLAGVVFSMPVLKLFSTYLDRFLSTSSSRGILAPAVAMTRIAVAAAILLACTLSLASGTHNPFIYFRF
jgi:alginate O-acetyltransferase complex protein AlgI